MEDNKIDIKLPTIDETQVPSLIEEQFSKMNDLKTGLEIAKKKAVDAGELAKSTKDMKTGFFKTKGTIESIQETQLILSEATMQNAYALEKTFEYQQAIADITKYLFGLGVTNIAMNRCVVKELEMRLNHASEEEIDELARNEIKNVVKELKNQEDIIKKQIDFSTKLKDFNDKLNSINQIIDKDEYDISTLINNNKDLNNNLNELENKLNLLDNKLDLLVKDNKYKNKNNRMIIIIISIVSIILLILAILGIIL